MSEISDSFEYSLACLGSVTYRTNGPQGGDGGHGGFLEIVFDTERGSTELEVGINGSNPIPVDSVMLRFRGDQEMEAAAQMFAFLSSKLKADIA